MIVLDSGKSEHIYKRGFKYQLFQNRHELERYMLLKHVKTDSGRARAWLRSSLNEHSLERYFHMMINDGSERILQFYEPHAFIIDQAQ